MSNFNEFMSDNNESDTIDNRVAITVNFLCSACNEPVTTAYVIPGEKGKTEWTCSKGHVSSMRWMP